MSNNLIESPAPGAPNTLTQTKTMTMLKIEINRTWCATLTAVAIAALTACGGGGSSSSGGTTAGGGSSSGGGTAGGGSPGTGGVVNVNIAPTFRAGDDAWTANVPGQKIRKLYVGFPVLVRGSAADSNGDALTFKWSFTKLPGGAAAPQLNDANTASPSFTPLVAGEYELSGYVSDGTLNSATDSMTSYVVPAMLNTAERFHYSSNRKTNIDCARMMPSVPPAPVLKDEYMVEVDRILKSVGATHAYSVFARNPDWFMDYVRSGGYPVLDEANLVTAVHEVSHEIDSLGLSTCFDNSVYRFAWNSGVFTSDLPTTFEPMRLIALTDAIPLPFRDLKYQTYITGEMMSRQRFGTVLEETNSYIAGAELSLQILKSDKYSYIAYQNAANLDGLLSFMLYLQAYLKVARTTDAFTYNGIKGLNSTITLMQMQWTKSEQLLVDAYPFTPQSRSSTAAFDNTFWPSNQQKPVPINVEKLREVYKPEWLEELDRLGIRHKTAADWSATYLK